MLRTEKLNIMDLDGKIALRRIAISLIASLFGFLAIAQPYKSTLAANPERAGGVFSGYVVPKDVPSKAPKGYKPFYISHYGRHGSRYHTSASLVGAAIGPLMEADSAGILTDEGRMVARQLDTLLSEHEGMYGMLTAKGASEHRGIGNRMYSNYPSVFNGKGGRDEVECVSSYWPRCLVSMANLCTGIQECTGGLHFIYITGPKYLDYISMDLDTKELGKEARKTSRKVLESLTHSGRFMCAMFKDTARVKEFVPDALSFMDKVYTAACISSNTDSKPDLFSHFTTDELYGLWAAKSDRLYYSFGISKEAGDYSSAIAKPLIADIVSKADAAMEPGSKRAADLRFGHDVGLLPLIGTIGIKGMETRLESSRAHERFFSSEMTPMAANLQMVFYRNRKGNVLVRLLYNEKETCIPALKCATGSFYRWEDLREYLINVAAAIPDDSIVKDNGGVERTGING